MAEDMNQLLRRARSNRTPVAPPLDDDSSSDGNTEHTETPMPVDMNALLRAGLGQHTVINTKASDHEDTEGASHDATD
jgi:hypothetical protein